MANIKNRGSKCCIHVWDKIETLNENWGWGDKIETLNENGGCYDV
jgi:hypothetical protein